MNYSAVVFTGNKFGSLPNSILNQLQRHFAVWLLEDPLSTFVFRWIKDGLIFETDSSFLFSKWLLIEREYVNYMLSKDQLLFVAAQYQDYEYSNVA